VNKQARVFYIVCAVLFVLMGLFKWLIKDVPNSVTRHIDRQRYIEDVLVKGQKYNPEKLQKLAEIDEEIEDIASKKTTCCFGLMSATEGYTCCGCIPFFSMDAFGGGKSKEWTDPLDAEGKLPMEETKPETLQDYSEIQEHFKEITIDTCLPANMKSTKEKIDKIERPHRATRLFEEGDFGDTAKKSPGLLDTIAAKGGQPKEVELPKRNEKYDDDALSGDQTAI